MRRADPEMLAMLWVDWWLNAPMPDTPYDVPNCIDDFMVWHKVLTDHGFDIYHSAPTPGGQP